MNKNVKKQTLLTSALTLLLSICMFVGCTYAWFTDSVTSAANVIQSGTLDIVLEKWNGTKWENAENGPIFNYENWEPGYTQVVNLRVANEGTLSFKWHAAITTSDELSALADVINVYVKSGLVEATTRDEINYAEFEQYTLREFVNQELTEVTTGTMNPGDEEILGIVVKMDENAGNQYQGLDLCGTFDFIVLAAQNTYEEDSFGNDYDEEAKYLPLSKDILTNDELEYAFSESGKYKLGTDLTNDNYVISEGSNVVIDLKGNTLTANNGLVTEGTSEIKNGTIANASTGYVARTTEGAYTEYDNINVVSKGGGVNVWGEAVFKGGSITLNSTSTSARHVFYVATEGAKLTIEDGTFVFNPTNLTRKGSYLCADSGATIIVNGGSFAKPSTRTAPIQELNGGQVIIYGGTFQFNPSNYVAEGYEAIQGSDGWWTVSAIQ